MHDDRTERAKPDGVLLAALALAWGAPLALAPWPASCALVASLAVLRTSLPRLLLIVSLAALGAARANVHVSSVDAAHQRVAQQLAQRPRCELRVVVDRSPRWLPAALPARGAVPSDTRGRWRLAVSVHEAACEGRSFGAPFGATLYVDEDWFPSSPPVRGDELRVLADIAARERYHNPELGDPRPRFAWQGVASGRALALLERRRGEGVHALIDRARARVRERIIATFPLSTAAMARALVLGETTLDDQQRDAFRDSGLAHLLAVSGAHLVVAVLLLHRLWCALLRRMRWVASRIDSQRPAALVSALLAWLYADFAGGGGSAYRAAAMLSVLLLARALGRRPCSSRAFAISLLGGVLLEPLALCELSFLLSVAATAGLLLLGVLLPRVVGSVARLVAATVAATVACTPILLRMNSPLPLTGVLANLIAAPVGEAVALPACLAHAALWWWPAAEQGAAALASGALTWVAAVAHAASAPSWATWYPPPPTDWQLALLPVGLAVATRGARWRRRARLPLLIVLIWSEVSAVAAGAPHGVLRVSCLDVGQGDALLIDLPDGRAVLLDGGGAPGSQLDVGERVVWPVLRARRRDRLAVVAVSHPHPDHYLGVLTPARRVVVGEVWDNGVQPRPPDWRALRQELAARGTRLRTPASLCKAPWRAGGASIALLAPCPPLADASANDNSLVLRVAYGEHRAVLLGDAERAAERRLLQSGRLRRSDFVKVGHHGSATSSSAALVAALAPRVVAISCGIRNRFGHPHRKVLAAWRRHGAVVGRTDRHGALWWRSDGTRARWGDARSPPFGASLREWLRRVLQ